MNTDLNLAVFVAYVLTSACLPACLHVCLSVHIIFSPVIFDTLHLLFLLFSLNVFLF